MIPTPITHNHADVARIGGDAIETVTPTAGELCKCPVCHTTQVTILGVAMAYGNRVSMFTPQMADDMPIHGNAPLTIAVVVRCSFGHEFAPTLRQYGSEVRASTYHAD